MAVTAVLDAVLDRSVVGGYTRIGSSLRRRWWPADAEPGSMSGRRVVVTGATSGIGEAAAAGLARLGATVHLLGRNPDKVGASAEALRRAQPDAEVEEEICDLADLDAVRSWALDLRDRVPAVHGLLHNAGLMTPERTETAQGHEATLAVHVLAPHLVTALLLDPLRAAHGSSVVWMSSGGMYGARLHAEDEDDLQFRVGRYDPVQAYARTKRMQVVLADAWSQSLRAAGAGDVRVESMHPGWVATPGVSQHLPTFEKVTGPLLRTADDGADTAVWLLATRPMSRPGHFWHDRAQRPTTFGWERPQDPTAVARLLDFVERSTGSPVGIA